MSERISTAVVCCNCDVLSSPDKHGRCAHCGSEYIVSVARALNRETLRITPHHLFLLDVLKPVVRWAGKETR